VCTVCVLGHEFAYMYCVCTGPRTCECVFTGPRTRDPGRGRQRHGPKIPGLVLHVRHRRKGEEVMRSPCTCDALDPPLWKIPNKARCHSLSLSDCTSGTGAEVVPCRGGAGGRDLGVLHGLLLVRRGLEYFHCALTTVLDFLWYVGTTVSEEAGATPPPSGAALTCLALLD